jgi:hypothetical protein
MLDVNGFLSVLHGLPNTYPFALLACLPGVIALYNLIWTRQSFARSKASIKATRDRALAGAGQPILGTFEGDIEDARPGVLYMVCGAVALTVVFGVVAAHGGANFGIVSAPHGAVLPNDLGAIYKKDGDLKTLQLQGLAGLVFAGYGAYLYTVTLCISRLYSSALTAEFLTASALRSASALVLGFVAGATGVFGGLGAGQALFVFLFVGLFPSWAMDALTKKAQAFFKTRVLGVDYLPLRLIDGIDDGIADRLAEIGIWDVQHLAAADPFALAARTLFPLRRLIDWMDQANLIGYVREEIPHFRAVGIRGAIDFAALFRDLMGIKHPVAKLRGATLKRYRRALQKRATALFRDLSKKTHLSRPSLGAIGRALYEDAVVNSLWNLWFEPDDGPNADAGIAVVPAAA